MVMIQARISVNFELVSHLFHVTFTFLRISNHFLLHYRPHLPLQKLHLPQPLKRENLKKNCLLHRIGAMSVSITATFYCVAYRNVIQLATLYRLNLLIPSLQTQCYLCIKYVVLSRNYTIFSNWFERMPTKVFWGKSAAVCCNASRRESRPTISAGRGCFMNWQFIKVNGYSASSCPASCQKQRYYTVWLLCLRRKCYSCKFYREYVKQGRKIYWFNRPISILYGCCLQYNYDRL